ncbi:MAG: [LysW]-lysine hydrolase [Phycisphaerales bacterium]|nr:[LysW]-lysine hydrolase [Phycisphaerales bacterium]
MTDDDAIALLHDLVATPSVSTHESDAVALLTSRARAFGLRAEIDEVGNAVLTRGDEDPDAIEIMLLGHIDTVPGEIPVRIEDGVLHGRGSVDAKGPLCAMTVAACRAELPERTRVVVVGAVEEEVSSSRGARHIARRPAPDACLIGEPSHWDGVTLGYKGRLIATIRVERPWAHASGVRQSPAEEAIDAWTAIRDHATAFNEGRSKVFETLQATIEAFHTTNDGLLETATMRVGFRLPPDLDPPALMDRIGDLGCPVTFEGGEVAVVTDRSDPVVCALSAAIRALGTRAAPKFKTGTSDMNVVGPIWRCPIAAYGPGDSTLDHTPEERQSLDEYLQSIRVLTRAIESLPPALESRRVARAGA